MSVHMNKTFASLIFCAGLGVFPVQAQDEAAASSPNAGTPPRAAEIAGLSSKTLLLGIARAGDHMVAVGDRGNILLSVDGEKWEQVPVPVNVTLTAVSFADDKNGWAVGHDAAILHSADGGRSWSLQHFDPALGQPALNVLALDAQRAMVVGAYGMWFGTGDGGKTWAEVTAPAIRDDGMHLNALIKLGDGSLFIAGETGLIGVSSADCQTWERLTLPYEGSLFGALPRGDKGALVFGLRGNVLMTDDVRSNAWTPVDIGSVQSIYGGAVLAQGRSVLVGADGEIVYVSADAKVTRAPKREGAEGNGAGSLSGALPWRDGLQLVGESGAGRATIP